MTQNIVYNGFSTAPDDYMVPDGELALSINMLREERGLQPIAFPRELLKLEQGQQVRYIHKNSGYEHFIIEGENGKLSYWDRKNRTFNDMLTALYAWRPDSPYYGWKRDYVDYYQWSGSKCSFFGWESKLYGWKSQGTLYKWEAQNIWYSYHWTEVLIPLFVPAPEPDPESGGDEEDVWVSLYISAASGISVGSPVFEYFSSEKKFVEAGTISVLDTDNSRITIAFNEQYQDSEYASVDKYGYNINDTKSVYWGMEKRGDKELRTMYVFFKSQEITSDVYDYDGTKLNFEGFVAHNFPVGGTLVDQGMIWTGKVFVMISDIGQTPYNNTYTYTNIDAANEDTILYNENHDMQDMEVTSAGHDSAGKPFFVAGGLTYHLTGETVSWERRVFTGIEHPYRGAVLYDEDGTDTGNRVMSVTMGSSRILAMGEDFSRIMVGDEDTPIHYSKTLYQVYTDNEAPMGGDVLYNADGELTDKTVASFVDYGFIASDGLTCLRNSELDQKQNVVLWTKNEIPSEGEDVFESEDEITFTKHSTVSSYIDDVLYTTAGEECTSTGRELSRTEYVYTTSDEPKEDSPTYTKNGEQYVEATEKVLAYEGNRLVLDNNKEFARHKESDIYYGQPVVYLKTNASTLTIGEAVYDKDGNSAGIVDQEGKVKGIPYEKWNAGNIRKQTDETIADIKSIGNVLIITTDKHMHYTLWKENEAGKNTPAQYVYLGCKLPEVKIDFTNVYEFDENGDFKKVTDLRGGGFARYQYNIGTMIKLTSASMEVQNYIKTSGLTAQDPDSVINDSDEDGATKKAKLTNLVLGKVNKELANATEQGLFVLPRLLRIALKLYDGSYACYSEPFLICAHSVKDCVSGTPKKQYANIYPFIERYFIRNLSELKQWKDIVKGISVFASEPIYDYDQSGVVEKVSWKGSSSGTTYISVVLPEISMADQIRKLENTCNFYKIYDIDLEKYHSGYSNVRVRRVLTRGKETSDVLKFRLTYTKKTGEEETVDVSCKIPSESTVSEVAEILKNALDKYEGVSADYVFNVKNKDEKSDTAEIVGTFCELCITSCYGKVEMGNISDFADFFAYVTNRQGGMLIPSLLPLSTLEQQKVITDDYYSHNEILPKVMYNYNGRMNYANIKRGFYHPTLHRNYQNPYDQTNPFMQIDGMWFYITAGERDIIVKGECKKNFFDLNYIYYPDKHCYRCVVKMTRFDNSTVYCSFPMTANDLLNGATFVAEIPVSTGDVYVYTTTIAYAYSGAIRWAFYRNATGFSLTQYIDADITADPLPSEETDCEELANTIINTEVGNPFYWNAKGYNDVGNNEIVGLSTSTVALSQGQFGQYPVYVFCGDGVYSLDIDGSGYYISNRPVTRDVAYKGSICQTDDAVLFAAQRGIMMLSGKNAILMTEKVDGKLFDFRKLKGYGVIQELANVVLEKGADKVYVLQDFRTFMQGCRIAYDYTYQRVYVFNPDYGYSYIYSLKTKEWGMCMSDYTYPINSYPECLVMTSGNNVVDLSSEGDGVKPGLAVTRPLKLGMADVLKTTDSIIQRGVFERGHVKCVLYGSRDLQAWQLVWSSNNHYMRGMHGTPYKYFRLVLICNGMTLEESVDGCTVNFLARKVNQIR